MKTKAYTKISPQGKVKLLKEKEPQAEEHTAEWEETTVAMWKKVEPGRRVPPVVIEKNVWKFMLLRTTLFSVTRENGELSAETLKLLHAYKPGLILKELIRPVIDSAYLNREEIARLNRECVVLFRAEGKLTDPHPFIEEAIDAIAFKERYGIPLYSSRDEMQQRSYMALRLISNVYAESTNQKDDAQRLRNEAKKLAGIR